MTGELKFDEKETLTQERFIAFATQCLGRELKAKELEGMNRLVDERGLAEVYGGLVGLAAEHQLFSDEVGGMSFLHYLREVASCRIDEAIETRLLAEEITLSDIEIDY
jgi:hypothetical protein